MILSDLLNSAVYSPAGEKVGLVADVRFVLDGPVPRSGSIAGARLLGLVVGPHRAGSFMGYERSHVNRPWPLAQLLARRERGSFLVLWEDVASARKGHVGLRDGYTRHDPSL